MNWKFIFPSFYTETENWTESWFSSRRGSWAKCRQEIKATQRRTFRWHIGFAETVERAGRSSCATEKEEKEQDWVIASGWANRQRFAERSRRRNEDKEEEKQDWAIAAGRWRTDTEDKVEETKARGRSAAWISRRKDQKEEVEDSRAD